MTVQISIPAQLLPHDGRFGSGPAKVRAGAVQTLADVAPAYLGTSHRRPPVKATIRRIRSGLRSLFSLPDGYEIVLGNGGSTAFWDIAAYGLIERRSRHAVYGAFGRAFVDVVRAAPHLRPADVVEAAFGEFVSLDPASGIDAYALIHNETSTGVMATPRRVPGGLMLVDGTSAAGAVPFDVEDVDAYYFSPQKAFGADGGLWITILSPAAIERSHRIAESGRSIPPFLSLTAAIARSRNDETVNTPALATLYLLDSQIGWLLDQGGVAWAARRCQATADRLYRWAGEVPYATPFVSDPSRRSPVTVTIDMTVDTQVLDTILRAHGILDTHSYRKLGRNQLRVGVWPATDPDDVERLIASIEYVVERL